MEAETITTPEECPRYNICGANLCPYDQDIKYRVWYPEETVCAKQNMTEEFPWVKAQRKIARRCKDKDKYFVARNVNEPFLS